MSGRDLGAHHFGSAFIDPDRHRKLALHIADRAAAEHPDLPGRRIAHEPTTRPDVLHLLDAIGFLPHPQGEALVSLTLDTPPKTDVADILDKAADVIDRNGFYQGYLYDEAKADDGLLLQACPVDAVGAINIAAFGKPRWPAEDHPSSALAQAATLALQETVGKPVPGWNDEDGRTGEDVITALWETAERLRKETA